jgi:hypothetical protein
MLLSATEKGINYSIIYSYRLFFAVFLLYILYTTTEHQNSFG